MTPAVENLDPTSILFAQGFASLLLARSHGPALASFHGGRCRDLEKDDTGQEESSTQHCKRCGTLVIPGWTGSMRLHGEKLGKRNRENQTGKSRRSNLEWRCQCGWHSDQATSDAGTKRRFKKRKLSDLITPDEKASAIEGTEGAVQPAERPATPITVTSTTMSIATPRQSTSAFPSPATGPVLPNARAAHSKVKAVPSSSTSTLAQTSTSTRVVATTTPSLGQIPPSMRRKRTKREGLQALLAARNESETKELQGGALGLGSFLQGL